MKKRSMYFLVLVAFVLSFQSSMTSAASSGAKTQTIKYGTGAVYKGEVKNGKPSSKGIMTYSKNKVYNGYWINGKRNGYGVYTVKNVELTYLYGLSFNESNFDYSIYKGNWKNDQMNGTGNFCVV